MSFGSLTPLSRSLFGLLGVNQDMLLLAARGASAVGGTCNQPDVFAFFINAYCKALEYLVSKEAQRPLLVHQPHVRPCWSGSGSKQPSRPVCNS